MRILLVEDDRALCQHLKRKLAEEAFVADMVHDGDEANDYVETGVYDLIVLDLGLPGKGGLQLLRQWRGQHNATPVIILSGRNTWQDKIEGIEAGADDYMGKPFQAPELIARIRALLRRCQTGGQGGLCHRGFTLDERQQAMHHENGTLVQLTATEFRLLRCLMLNPQRIFSKEMLMSRLYDLESEFDDSVIEVHINHLRKKLGRDFIQTLRGQGYLLGRQEAP